MAEEQAEILAERAALAGEAFPEIDAAWREAQAAVAAVQREMAQFEQAMQLEEANRAHAERVLDQHKARELRLMQEKETLTGQDLSHVERQQMELEALEERAENLADYLENARIQLPDLDIALRQARQTLDNANRDQHRIDAELAALKRMQEAAQSKEREGASWLARAGLDRVQRLWQTIRVEPGWETAVEAALGEAMAALAAEVREEWLEQPPEGRFELLLPSPLGGGAGGEGARVDAPMAANSPQLPHPGPPPEGEGEKRWHARAINESAFDVYLGDALQGRVEWELLGEHNTQKIGRAHV
jgi:chromosome segregation protein